MARLSEWLNRNSMYIALVAAWVAMLGSLYFSEVRGYVPCVLCWYQRILMYPLAAYIAIGLLVRDPYLPYYIMPVSLLGMFVSTYHYLLEKTDIFASMEICKQGASCTTQWINWFGFMTIPFLALIGFLIITIMSVIAVANHQPAHFDDEGDPLRVPWFKVFGAVIVVCAIFAVLFITGKAEAQPTATGTISLANVTPGAQLTVNGQVSGDPALIAKGQQLYLQTCAACHGQDGKGVQGLGLPLVHSAFVAQKTDPDLVTFIRTGREHNDPANKTGGVMPPSGGRPDLKDDEFLAILAYVRSLH